MQLTTRSIRLLSQFGASALRSSIIGGRYQAPMIPPRIAANMRKRAIKEGTYGSFVPHVGGWDPAWDKQKKIYFLRPFKGHKTEKNRPERVKQVDEAMAAMPDRIKKMRKEWQDKKPKKDILFAWEKAIEVAKAKLRR